ncbi:RHS repeat domain-containing protein [Thioalkalivibrio sp. XN279]|uniref:RHS repeat domain-containing protein n=1 Tax=Thioalkalivibrio sp. XN279 TaxID=2714953 RepID=UPI00140911FE|nr:RHS repeat domain-containing protein [Thioalkalivibrio sp. XN279]NHA16189.1 RHS repeat protein [Thioalkalivibrio sp. XN279]
MNGFRTVILLVAVAGGLGFPGLAGADDAKERWEEHGELVRSRQSIDPLGSGLFGENVNYYSGGLSFYHADISIPGNSVLPVAIGRSYAVTDLRNKRVRDLPFADWDLDLPYVQGVYAAQSGWVRNGSPAGSRCSVNQLSELEPPTHGTVDIPIFGSDYWNGIQMNLPGRGGEDLHLANNHSTSLLSPSATQVPAPAGGPWYWVTANNDRLACLPTIQNGSGEGFRAVTADGVEYRFDRMAMTVEPDLREKVFDQAGAPISATVSRRRVRLYATHVEDRFGNWVAYSYSNGSTAPVRLTGISSSDGRAISLAYNAAGHISSITENGRTWTYGYSTFGGKKTLSSVTRPDGSSWTIAFGSLSSLSLEALPIAPGEPWDCRVPRDVAAGQQAMGTLTHPSGAIGTFVVEPRLFGRSNVPLNCTNYSAPLYDPYGGDSVYPLRFYSPALITKTIAGPGLDEAQWDYSYGGLFGFAPIIGASWARVDGPAGEWVELTYGNAYQIDEGLQKSVVRGGPTGMLETTLTEYDLNPGSQPYPYALGKPSAPLDSSFPSRVARPAKKRTITRQGTSFIWEVTQFDVLARPVSITRKSVPGPMRTETTTYSDNLNLWVLGQVESVLSGGHSLVQNVYDPQTALPVAEYRNGALRFTLDWNTDGTLKWADDALDQRTGLYNWMRGIPQLIVYPDDTTSTAVVNARGEITSITDPLGFTHTYQYDAMGRVSQVNYPTGDPVAWQPTQSTFEPVGYAEYGLPAGHWRQTVATGNHRRITYFDAGWRPVLTHEYDAANPGGTSRCTARHFDHADREVFASYPLASVTTWSGVTSGIHTTYDALGRVSLTRQTSEQGDLDTVVNYLPGFQRSVTDPRGATTTSTFHALDTPDYGAPLVITAPEGQTTTITRDLFGKPLSITRSGTYDGVPVSATRHYIYDAHMRLCRRIDPESGATIIDYDLAGRTSWTVTGSSATTVSGDCSRASVSPSSRTVFGYDVRNRVTGVTYPGTTEALSYAYHDDGTLEAITRGNSAWVYEYNRRRLLTQETLYQTGETFAFGLAYDATGNLTSRSYPGGLTIDYQPNALGQPTRAGSYATGAQYHPDGQLAQLQYGNGIVRSVSRTARGLPDWVQDTYGATAFHDFDYDYDANGNVSGITDQSDDGSQGRQDRAFLYDGLNRLVQASAPGMWGTATYEYDPLDNLRQASVGARAYSYSYHSSNGRLTAISGSGGAPSWSFGYDARGNQLTRSGSGTTQTRVFDNSERITSIAGLASYYYDGHGRRTQTTRQDGSALISVYTTDGVLRYQRDDAAETTSHYVELGGTMVAQVERPFAPTGVPTLTAPASNSTGNYTVSWTAVSGATRYELEQRLNGGSWSLIHNAADTSKALSGQGNGTWGYRVRACNSGGCGAYSAIKSTVVTLPPSGVPSLIAPSSNSTGSYTVSWGAVSGATSYQLEERLNSGGWSTIHNASGTSKARSGRTTGTWGYRVRACNAVGCGSYSSLKTTVVTLPPTGVPTPSGPGFLGAPASYTISWTTVSNATSYQLQQQLNGGSWSTVYDGAGTGKSFSGMGAGSWNYRARACNSAGCGAYSATHSVWVENLGGCIPGFGCTQPESVPEDPPGTW